MAATHWIRFQQQARTGFGILLGDTVHEYHGDMFGDCSPTGQQYPLAGLKLLAPTVPTKVIALWNNFHALGAKLNLPVPSL